MKEISRPLDQGLMKLRNMINDMRILVRKTLESAYSDKATAKRVREMSDELLFLMDEVSDFAVQLMARYQPVATDLREIKSVIQIAYDFSRIGRYAANISETYSMMPGEGCDTSVLQDMFRIVFEMVDEAGRAYVEKDLALAEKVRRRDDEVDGLYAECIKQLIQMGGKIDIKCLLSLALTLRYLERIADHAVYIADSTIYTITGRK